MGLFPGIDDAHAGMFEMAQVARGHGEAVRRGACGNVSIGPLVDRHWYRERSLEIRSPNAAAHTRDFEVVHVPDFAGYAMNFGTDLQTPGRPHGLFKDG